MMRSTFIGGGNMASAMVGGLLARGERAADIAIVEPLPPQREKLAARFPGVGVHAAVGEGALAGADIVVLAVKPQQMQDAARQLSPFIGVVPLVLTIAAGVRAPTCPAGSGATTGSSGRCRIRRR